MRTVPVGWEQLSAWEASAEDAPRDAAGPRPTDVPSTAPSHAARPRPGAAPTRGDRSRAHGRCVCRTGAGGRGLDAARASGRAAPIAPGTTLTPREGGEEKAPADPSCSPSSLPPCTPAAELINPSGAGTGRYRAAAHGSSSKARCRPPVPQTPKFPGTGRRHRRRPRQRGHRHAVSATGI